MTELHRYGAPISNSESLSQVQASELDLSAIRDRPQGEVGSIIWHFQSLPSTNQILLELARLGKACHGAVVVADEQVAGRGRQGRTWHSPPGGGLFCSFLLDPIDISKTYCLAAIAARKAIKDVTGVAPDLKWPNDLLIRKRKVGGILIEQTRWAAVLGIGINTDMSESQIARIGPEATSLSAACGTSVARGELFECLLERIQVEYIRSSRSPEVVFREWRDALITIGQTVEVETSREKWVGRATDVAPDGALLVTNDRRLVRVYAADVRIRS